LLKGNSPLNKVELDIPCLRLSEDGKLLGVLKEVLALCPKGDYCHDNAPLEFEEEDLILTTEILPRMTTKNYHLWQQQLEAPVQQQQVERIMTPRAKRKGSD
jgi:hypothetical protein